MTSFWSVRKPVDRSSNLRVPTIYSFIVIVMLPSLYPLKGDNNPLIVDFIILFVKGFNSSSFSSMVTVTLLMVHLFFST